MVEKGDDLMRTRTELMTKWVSLIAKEWKAQALILSMFQQEASARYKEYLQDAATVGITQNAGKYWSAICNRAWKLVGGNGKPPKP